MPNGYLVRYRYNNRQLIIGGSILAGSFTITTLIASGIAISGFGFLYAPAASVPVIGAYPVAVVGAMTGVGPGTVGALIGFSVLQGIGFGVLMHGLATRRPVGLEPRCEARNEERPLVLSPLVAPNMAGLSLGGAL